MNSDVHNTVERINNRINELHQTIDALEESKALLLREFSNGRPKAAKRNGVHAESSNGDKSRKQQAIDLIIANGPMKRRALMEASGAPIGTISYLLHDKETFRRLEDGRWDIAENMRAVTSN